jgi:hypothetical protein
VPTLQKLRLEFLPLLPPTLADHRALHGEVPLLVFPCFLPVYPDAQPLFFS